MFHSYYFILAFLPTCVILFHALNSIQKPHIAKAFLIGMSLLFYGLLDVWALVVLLGTILFGYVCVQRILAGKKKKFWCALSVTAFVLVLGFFKYMNFFLSSLCALLGMETSVGLQILLPVGISFFVFQAIAVSVDAYRGELLRVKFSDYLFFMTYFPKISAGPLADYQALVQQLDGALRTRITAKRLSDGVTLFICGLGKKVLLADVFAKMTNYGVQHTGMLGTWDTLLVMLAYCFQIYFDFSGYSDMAVGISGMLGIELPYNFESPYKAISMREFWKRWHKTLTAFLTKYIYIPLGGNRKGTCRMVVNTLIVFTISGIWHGAGVGFVIWGISGGVGVLLSKAFDKQIAAFSKRMPGRVVLWMLTFMYLCIFWIFFMYGDAQRPIIFFQGLTAGGAGLSRGMTQLFMNSEVWYACKVLHLTSLPFGEMLPILFYIALAFLLILIPRPIQKMLQTYKPSILLAVLLGFVLLLSFLHLSSVASYIYYQF